MQHARVAAGAVDTHGQPQHRERLIGAEADLLYRAESRTQLQLQFRRAAVELLRIEASQASSTDLFEVEGLGLGRAEEHLPASVLHGVGGVAGPDLEER